MKTYKVHSALPMQGETLETLAHDLRTPMSSVAGAAQLALLASGQGKPVEAQLQQILVAVGAMDRMLSRMCGAEQAAFTAKMLERELRDIIGPRAQEKAQELIIDLSAAADGEMTGSFAALTRVLSNLLSNAVKYTPSGGRIALLASRGEAGDVVFTVEDNGMGMKHGFLREIYRPFARARESEHIPGAGLGLSIVRRLVREMGGEISVSSEWGRGTIFAVRLPLMDAREAARA